MIRFSQIVGLVGLLAIGITTAWLWYALRPMAEVLFGAGHVRHEWHQKLSLTVETPEGARSGSAVAGVMANFGRQLSGNEVAYAYTGEAAVVEVAPGKYLFALLGGTEERYACAAGGALGWLGPWLKHFPKTVPTLNRGEWLAEVPRQAGKPAVAVPRYCLPMLVTFDDIADPKSVRQVDVNDMDAAFGCPATGGVAMPWRQAGLTWRQWQAEEVARRATAGASARAGLTGRVAAALEETFRIDPPGYGPSAAEKLRLKELAEQFTPEEKRRWEEARKALEAELPATLPTPEALAASAGGPCHRLGAVTIAVTEEPVTAGRVEGVLGWLAKAEFIIPPELQPRYVKDQTAEQRLMPSDFIDRHTLRARRQGSN